MRGSKLGGLRLSVTLCGFCPSDEETGVVTLRTTSAAALGRVAAVAIGIPRSRVRCAATLQRGPQKRAVERLGLSCELQCEHLRPSANRAILVLVMN
jgi:hypothetical protein